MPKFSLQLSVHASHTSAIKGEFELLSQSSSGHRCHFVVRRKLLYDENEDYENDGGAGQQEVAMVGQDDDEWEKEWQEELEREPEYSRHYDEEEGCYWENIDDLEARPWRTRIDVNCY